MANARRLFFPRTCGHTDGAESVKVTPRFTEERTEDAVRLTGIYHIAANVEFDEEEARQWNIEIQLFSLTMLN